MSDIAHKFRASADSLQSRIDACFADRETNTPKRARQAAEKRNEGATYERGQAMLRALADCCEAGTLPAVLAGINSRAAVVRLAKEETTYNGGYYDAGRPQGRPYAWQAQSDRDQAAALWALLDGGAAAKRAADAELRGKLDALRFANIPGYFPTPAGLVADMIAAADLPAGARVLEPSAGSGAIADALREAGHAVTCVEHWGSLRDILTAKGHELAGDDFLQYPLTGGELFDAVLMNPPFEKGLDCQHVSRAWSFVKPGGALVAIMGAGVKFRDQAPYRFAREWLADCGAVIEDIPAGAFKESGTGVASVMVILHKPAEVAQAAIAPAPVRELTTAQMRLALRAAAPLRGPAGRTNDVDGLALFDRVRQPCFF